MLDNELFEFGNFRVEPAELLLRRDGQPVPLEPKVFETLLVLLRSGGRLVLKEELMRAVWPDSFVEESNLTRNISVLRKALDGNRDAVQYIETVPKRGYRFVGVVRTASGGRPGLIAQTAPERVVGEKLESGGETVPETPTDHARLRQSGEPQEKSHRRWLAAGTASLLVTLLAAVVFRFWPDNRPVVPEPWVQLTNVPDSVSQPALSPDGRMVAFVRGPETFRGPGQIYVKSLPDGELAQITYDSFNKMSPVFSPDGSRVVYTVNDGGQWDTWVVPLVNGQPRLWLPNASGLVWRDQHNVLFSEIKNRDIHMAIVTAQENRAGARDIYVPPNVRGMAHRSSPSPNGNWVLVVEMERGPWQPCRLVPMNGSSPSRPVGPPDAGCTSAAWSADGEWMYFSSSAGGTFHIWRQRFPAGEPEQITSGPTEEEGIAMAPDGRSFVTAVAMRQSVVVVHTSSGDRQVSGEGYSYDPKLTPDGKKLCYRILKDATSWYGDGQLRVMELGSGHNEALLPGLMVGGGGAVAYDISPDGGLVVAAARDRDSKPRLWLAALDGHSPPRQIGNVEGDSPLFGPDGEIFFRAIQGGSAFVHRISQDGTGQRKAVEHPISALRGISQDGQWLVVRLPGEEGTTVTALPVAGGLPLRVISPHAAYDHRLRWSPDGKFIFISVPTFSSVNGFDGHTYVVPLPAGEAFPRVPAGGFQSVAEIRELPGARMIDGFNVAPGPAPDMYAYPRATVQRNLFRVPIP